MITEIEYTDRDEAQCCTYATNPNSDTSTLEACMSSWTFVWQEETSYDDEECKIEVQPLAIDGSTYGSEYDRITTKDMCCLSGIADDSTSLIEMTCTYVSINPSWTDSTQTCEAERHSINPSDQS